MSVKTIDWDSYRVISQTSWWSNILLAFSHTPHPSPILLQDLSVSVIISNWLYFSYTRCRNKFHEHQPTMVLQHLSGLFWGRFGYGLVNCFYFDRNPPPKKSSAWKLYVQRWYKLVNIQSVNSKVLFIMRIEISKWTFVFQKLPLLLT